MWNDVCLGANALKRISYERMVKDFEFVVNGESHMWNSMLADVLSPKIARIHDADPSFDRYVVETPDEHNLFQFILSLSIGNTISSEKITEENVEFFEKIGLELENKEIISGVLRNKKYEISCETVLERIKLQKKMGLECDYSYVAYHFFEMEKSELDKLDCNDLMYVLESERLRVESEDNLIDYIISRCETDLESFSLMKTVKFSHVSSEKMTKFCAFVSNNRIVIDVPTWNQISVRLCMNVEQLVDIHRHYQRVFTVEKPANSYKGIISRFRKEHGDIYMIPEIKLFDASGVVKSVNGTEVTDWSSLDYYCSKNQPNQYLGYEFVDGVCVNLTGYALKSVPFEAGSDHPRSWMLEVSNDSQRWTVLNRVKQSPSLNGPNRSYYSTLQNISDWKYVRVRLTDVTWRGTNLLALSGFELYGTVKRPGRKCDEESTDEGDLELTDDESDE